MAKIETAYPVETVQGRVNKTSELYYCYRLGEKIASHYPLRRDPRKISAKQHANSAAFQAAVLQAHIELADPVRRAHWKNLFDAQPAPARYRVFRNFVIASLIKTPANTPEG